jgi:hypothetical protein
MYVTVIHMTSRVSSGQAYQLTRYQFQLLHTIGSDAETAVN